MHRLHAVGTYIKRWKLKEIALHWVIGNSYLIFFSHLCWEKGGMLMCVGYAKAGTDVVVSACKYA